MNNGKAILILGGAGFICVILLCACSGFVYLAAGGRENLVPNSGFDFARVVGEFQLPANWFAAYWYQTKDQDYLPPTYDAWAPAPDNSTNRVLKLVRRQADPGAGQFHGRRISGLAPHHIYLFGISYYVGSSGATDIDVGFYNAAEERIGAGRLIIDAKGISYMEGDAIVGLPKVTNIRNGWRRGEVKLAAPAEPAFCVISPRIHYGSPEDAPVYLDDFELTPTDLPPKLTRRKQVVYAEKKLVMWIEKSAERVWKKAHPDWNEEHINNTVKIYTATHEYESFQIVLTPRDITELKEITIKWGDFVGPGGARIARSNLTPYLVGYPKPDSDAPDVLFPFEPFNLTKMRNYPIWVTIYTPPDVPFGEYKGTIELTIKGRPLATLIVLLQVWDFTLPRETHFRTGLFDMWTNYIFDWYNFPGSETVGKNEPTQINFGAEYNAFMRKVFENYAQHRISNHQVMPIRWRELMMSGRNLTSTEIFKYFDDWAQFWVERGLAVNNVQLYGEIAEGELSKFYPLWQKHLRERGWLETAYTYEPIDEPNTPNDKKVVRRWGKALNQLAPGLKKLAGLNYSKVEDFQPFVGSIDIWGVEPLRAYRNPEIVEFFRQRQAAGEQVWWYIHHFKWTITDPALRTRMFFWIARKYGITGCVLWCVNYWHPSRIAKNPDGTFVLKDTWVDGILFYPGKDSLLNSIQWEIIRDGLEDVEYFYLLDRQIEALERKSALSDAEKQLLKEAQILARIPDELIADVNVYNQESTTLYEARQRIGEFLSQLEMPKQ